MCKLLMAALGGLMFVGVSSLPAAALLTQCPPVGEDSGCQFLLTVNAGGTVTVTDDSSGLNSGPYDGSDDALVGVLNNSTSTVLSLPLSSSMDIFNFDNDGLCTVRPAPSGCVAGKLNPADSSGYGGPGVTFSGISANLRSGVVNFSPGIAPGGTAYFALEGDLVLADIVPGSPVVTPGIPPSGVPEPISMALAGGGLGALFLAVRLRRHGDCRR